ncbi:MAG: hypothetical protein AB198_01755 [Parcubacteria bacterium C7867-003]|nr:MAG: hypothetical protein AB198_01755 [Parcubacteria bacterium C7867-003]
MICFIERFLTTETLPDAMQSFGIALLTIFIPLVIFLLEDARNSLGWDRIVILEKVIRAKRFLLAICLVFIPIFFWDFANLRIIFFIAFITGIWLIIRTLFYSYRWMRTLDGDNKTDLGNFRNILRNEYLTEKGDWNEKEKIWGMTWSEKIKSTVEERNLIKVFIKHFDSLLSDDEFSISTRFIRTFWSQFDNRTLHDWIVFGDLFEKVLEWNYVSFLRHKDHIEGTGIYTSEAYIIQSTLYQLIEKLVLSALQKGTMFLFFDGLKKHTIGKDENYLKQLFSGPVCRVFFDNIADSNESHNTWRDQPGQGYFPAEWKIKKETLNDQNNFIARIWLGEFLHWAQSRIQQLKNKDFDKHLDEVSSGLFPEVDPTTWAQLLTLLIKPWTENSRMKSLVENGTNFGFTIRMSIGDHGSIEDFSKHLQEQIKRDVEATIELITILFPHQFTENKIIGYIQELSILEYTENSIEDLKKKRLIKILQTMLNSQKNNL